MTDRDARQWWESVHAAGGPRGSWRIAEDVDVDAWVDDLAEHDIDVRLLDCIDVDGSGGFMDLCAETFELPEPGENWDALYDALSDLEPQGTTAVIVTNWQAWAADSREQAASAVDVIGDAVRQWGGAAADSCVLVVGEGPGLGMAAVIGQTRETVVE